MDLLIRIVIHVIQVIGIGRFIRGKQAECATIIVQELNMIKINQLMLDNIDQMEAHNARFVKIIVVGAKIIQIKELVILVLPDIIYLMIEIINA